MASLNLSLNGHEIRSSYQHILNGPDAPGSASKTRWALYTVTAPLLRDVGAKESVLKLESSRSGELDELIDEFNEGRIQFAFVKVKDPNTGLFKFVLIGWCGDGLPERTKGYFTSHLNAVAKVLHSYHVQIIARSRDDLSPEGILKKIADASGAKYSASAAEPSAGRAPPVVAKKPVFTPTTSSAAYNPLVVARNRRQDNVDEDGWGADAPPVTRTQLEKVAPAYKPTKVNLADLTKSKPSEPARQPSAAAAASSRSADVIGGSYQPIGKVDIAAIRAAAAKKQDDRPTVVKGAYEPVGKVDIAAIRARASRPAEEEQEEKEEPVAAPRPKPVSERTAAFSSVSMSASAQPGVSERLTSLPKPKVANKFGGGGAAFVGTKPPLPSGPAFGTKPVVPVGSASRTFADQGGKTPAQIWAEKKARQSGGGSSNAVPAPVVPEAAAPLSSQRSGTGSANGGNSSSEWKSGYKGKSWAAVQTTNFGRAGAVTEQRTGEEPQHEDERPTSSGAGGVAALRDRFKGNQPMGQHAPASSISHTHTGGSTSRGFGGAAHGEAEEETAQAPPPLPAAARPSGGFQLPGLAARQVPPPPPQEEEEEEEEQRPREPSPVRIAVPVAREPSPEPDPEPEREATPPPPPLPPVPAAAAAPIAARHDEEEEEQAPAPAGGASGLRAYIHYDYVKAEDNEIDLVEGEYVTEINPFDKDWWIGTNSRGESGMFPSEYVEVVPDEDGEQPEAAAAAAHKAEPEPEHAAGQGGALPTATALYDNEAGEDNELSFPEGALIENIEFPDADWWFGSYKGNSGLFPSEYVSLNH